MVDFFKLVFSNLLYSIGFLVGIAFIVDMAIKINAYNKNKPRP